MKWKRMIAAIKKAYVKYDLFMEKQGFGIVLAVCLMIILSSALFTYRLSKENHSSTPLEEASVETGVHEAQTLQEAQELVSSKNIQALTSAENLSVFIAPVEGFLVRDFALHEPVYFAAANYYRLHPAIDFLVDYGTPVKASAAGKVKSVQQEKELGLTIRIQNSEGYEAVYAGLSDASYVKAGDLVAQGQTIGHTGNGVFAESKDEPHLHFETWFGKTPVDPVELFLGIDY